MVFDPTKAGVVGLAQNEGNVLDYHVAIVEAVGLVVAKAEPIEHKMELHK